MRDKPKRLKIACPSCRQKLDLSDLAPFTHLLCPTCGGGVIVPRPFGNLMLEEPLGRRAGMAVYRALDLTLDREVTVKILEEDSGGVGDAFLDLARGAASVNHPGVVPIYSCGTEESKPFLVSQFMSGGPLSHHLGAEPASEEDLRRVFGWCQVVAGGLAAAHGQGILHGTVCPSSVFLDADGNAKIGDFGLGSLLAGGQVERSPLSEQADYLPPERRHGEGITTAGDMYSLGVLLYRVACGVLPSAPAAAPAVPGGGEPPASGMASLRERNPCVPPDVSDLCGRMLAADPAARPQHFDEVARVLSEASKTRAFARVVSEKRPKAVRVEAPLARRLSDTRRRLFRRERRSRERLLNLLLTLSFLLIVLLLGLHLARRRGWFGPWGRTVPGDDAPPSLREPGADPGAGSAAGRGAGDGGAVRPVAPSRERAPGSGPEPDPEAMARHTGDRPRPRGLDFAGVKEPLKRYLQRLPAEMQALERERLEYVATTREYLVQLMRYLPFEGGREAEILLADGRRIRAQVPYCNDRGVALRTGGAERLIEVPWNDLAPAQYLRFLGYYIQQREEQGRQTEGGRNRKLGQEVADDCLRAALLAEWYGQDRVCREFAERAVRAAPGLEAKVRRLVAGSGF